MQLKWSEQHVARQVPLTGYRRVTLDILTRGEVRAQYDLDHYWRCFDGIWRSTIVVRAPAGMAGTAILLHEEPGRGLSDAWLRLSVAKRTLVIQPDYFQQRILGSEFCYEDLGFWYPLSSVNGLEAREIGDDVLIEARRRLPNGRAASLALKGDRAGNILSLQQIGDWPGDSREFATDAWADFDGFGMPISQTATAGGAAQCSRMTLNRAEPGARTAETAFDTEALAAAAATREAWTALED